VSKRIDLHTGQKFGRLSIIEKTNKIGPNWKHYYLCKCDCGNFKEIAKSDLLYKVTISCGCFRKEFMLSPEGEASNGHLYCRCRSSAKYRGILFDITREQHKNLINQNCYYCGSEPVPFNAYLKKDGTKHKKNGIEYSQEIIERAWIVANTIDRIDSSKGYLLDNCVPSCWPCNEMKSDRSVKDFLQQITKILEYQSNREIFFESLS